mmetsp:Transcript_13157/g.36851  ORF Transcript_13157/g.36851 Transcript_13157/m.36851 type:complete len:843 (-) Transcript_13157:554-3082(-)
MERHEPPLEVEVVHRRWQPGAVVQHLPFLLVGLPGCRREGPGGLPLGPHDGVGRRSGAPRRGGRDGSSYLHVLGAWGRGAEGVLQGAVAALQVADLLLNHVVLPAPPALDVLGERAVPLQRGRLHLLAAGGAGGAAVAAALRSRPLPARHQLRQRLAAVQGHRDRGAHGPLAELVEGHLAPLRWPVEPVALPEGHDGVKVAPVLQRRARQQRHGGADGEAVGAHEQRQRAPARHLQRGVAQLHEAQDAPARLRRRRGLAALAVAEREVTQRREGRLHRVLLGSVAQALRQQPPQARHGLEVPHLVGRDRLQLAELAREPGGETTMPRLAAERRCGYTRRQTRGGRRFPGGRVGASGDRRPASPAPARLAAGQRRQHHGPLGGGVAEPEAPVLLQPGRVAVDAGDHVEGAVEPLLDVEAGPRDGAHGVHGAREQRQPLAQAAPPQPALDHQRGAPVHHRGEQAARQRPPGASGVPGRLDARGGGDAPREELWQEGDLLQRRDASRLGQLAGELQQQHHHVPGDAVVLAGVATHLLGQPAGVAVAAHAVGALLALLGGSSPWLPPLDAHAAGLLQEPVQRSAGVPRTRRPLGLGAVQEVLQPAALPRLPLALARGRSGIHGVGAGRAGRQEGAAAPAVHVGRAPRQLPVGLPDGQRRLGVHQPVLRAVPWAVWEAPAAPWSEDTPSGRVAHRQQRGRSHTRLVLVGHAHREELGHREVVVQGQGLHAVLSADNVHGDQELPRHSSRKVHLVVHLELHLLPEHPPADDRATPHADEEARRQAALPLQPEPVQPLSHGREDPLPGLLHVHLLRVQEQLQLVDLLQVVAHVLVHAAAPQQPPYVPLN